MSLLSPSRLLLVTLCVFASTSRRQQGLVSAFPYHKRQWNARHSTVSLQASSSSDGFCDRVYDGYTLDTSSLQASLKAVRESMDSIQTSIDATKQTLEESSSSSYSSLSSSSSAILDTAATTTTISDATDLPSSIPVNDMVVTASAADIDINVDTTLPETTDAFPFVDMDDATELWNNVIAQLQQNVPSFQPVHDHDHQQYFPSGVGSMRDSLQSIQQSIQETQAIHNPEAVLATMLSVPDVPTEEVVVTTATAVVHRVPTLLEYLTGNMGVGAPFESQSSPSIVANDHQAWRDATQFLESASADSAATTMLSNAKIKWSMMVSNTYLVLGLPPPEDSIQSGAVISSSLSLFTAFFALLFAMGAKELTKSQAEEDMKLLILEYQRQQASLRSQMVSIFARRTQRLLYFAL